MPQLDSFKTRKKLNVGGLPYDIFSLGELAKTRAQVAKLPFSLKVLLENLLRFEDGRVVKKELVGAAVGWVDHAGPEYVELSRSYLRHGIGDPEMHETAESHAP